MAVASTGSRPSNCVEVAATADGSVIGVRDSKDKTGPVLTFTPNEWPPSSTASTTASSTCRQTGTGSPAETAGGDTSVGSRRRCNTCRAAACNARPRPTGNLYLAAESAAALPGCSPRQRDRSWQPPRQNGRLQNWRRSRRACRSMQGWCGWQGSRAGKEAAVA
jgi:Domain of unknown function (DUF397)